MATTQHLKADPFDTLRAQIARRDAEQDRRLRRLTRRATRRVKVLPARPAWLPAMPLKQPERRRLRRDVPFLQSNRRHLAGNAKATA